MDFATTKLELIHQLMTIMDEKTLSRVAKFFKKEVPAEEEDVDFTPEELEDLDRRRADRISGKSKGYSAEESIRMLREAQAKDEAA
ncbi:MAG: hypothetical protein WBO28_03350 [Flavobacteriales bacterium]|jgi:hypothetical protein